MKTRITLIAIAAVALALGALMFAACGDPNFEEEVRPDIRLRSLTIQPVEFNAQGQPINSTAPNADPITLERIPRAIIETDWDDAFYNFAEADSEELWFLKETHVETARLIVTATGGTEVTWGIGTTGSPPKEFVQPGRPLEFGNDDVIYVQVALREYTAGKNYRSYYRVHARLASATTLLSLVSVATRETTINPPADGRATWDAVKASSVATLPVSITLKEGQNGSDILATKLNGNSTIKYAVIPSGTNPADVDYDDLDFDYSDSDETIPRIELVDGKETTVLYKGAHIPFGDQDVLVAEVTAQNKDDKNYYKFRVSVGRIVNINRLEMIATTERADVLALGVPSATWGSVVSGAFSSAVLDPTFAATITLEDEDASFEFVKIVTAADPLPGSFNTPDPADPHSTSAINFENKSQLVVRVKSAGLTNGDSAAPLTYYKVQVNLQPALITVQPKSNAYHVTSHTYPTTEVTVEIDGEPVKQQRVLITAAGTRTLDRAIDPLGFTLSRPEGNYKYQWYTANSWYGGYGFDKDGRIVGDPDCEIPDLYHPTTERNGLDEKNNVSFHNGGNQFYRLPVGSYPDSTANIPGVTPATSYAEEYDKLKIVGATDATYVPVIDASKRPFIAGYSNQTQYYWVVISDPDTGREVISEWAAIVAEWGEEWDMGAPTGKKVTKKHHIVDLNAYMTPDGIGMREKPRNTAPFKAGNHGDKYSFPITFPSGWNVKDYSVATIQAKFYLADGTVWIQNWTQGDVGFENASKQGLVLYYNLTNNNATVGLTGDSKEPQGADLNETPRFVVIKPAGTKSITSRPPFQGDGKTPRPNNDAQGWFTPYIEIVELRFEGPAR